MDDESYGLMLRLQHEDLESIRSSEKGKANEDEVSSSAFAIQLFEQELQHMKAILAERAMSRSLIRAYLTDSHLFTEAIVKEDAIVNDHVIASRVGIGDDTACESEGYPNDSTSNRLAANTTRKLLALYMSREPDGHLSDGAYMDVSSTAESSAIAASRTSTNGSSHECISCGEKQRDFAALQAACGHCYCQQCLSRLFELAMTDETLFPPRCCQQAIPPGYAELYLDAKLVENFLEKSVEFTTTDRTYCAKPTCSSFIAPSNFDKATTTAVCNKCMTRTCIVCKGNTHAGECPQDVTIQTMLAFARDQGWQQCYKCHLIVELEIGCNHMTCRCGAQFCYVCGLQWKNCQCPQWDEERLLARAQQVVARDLPADAEVAVAQVQQEVDHLRLRHNCRHEGFKYIRGDGPYRCEECSRSFYLFICECRQCRIRICNECKWNRL